MVRYTIKEKIERDDITLNEVMDKCKIVDVLIFAGNISSILLYPLTSHLFKEVDETFKIYDEDIFLYAFDDVLELSNHIFIVVPFSLARRKYKNGSFFQVFSRQVERYYYDDDVIVFCYSVLDKHLKDYKAIIEGRYSDVGLTYLLLTEKNGIARSICMNSETIRDQWKTFELLLDPKEPIITDTRSFPEFIKERETYYAKSKNKK